MSALRRLMALLLCLVTLLPCALGQEASSAPQEASPASQEERIIPVHQPPEYVEKLLDIARGELGYTEEKNGATKYGVWTNDPTAEWCAEFLCWCVDQADKQQGLRLLNQVYPYYTGTNTGRDWFLRQGRYIARRGTVPGWGSQWLKGQETPLEKNSYIPLPGDWVFFSASATGDTTHVAMVEYCAYDEKGQVMVHVIEGNNPDAVARNVYPINYWAILGYGTVYDLADVVMRFGNGGEKVKALQRELVMAGLMEAQYVTGQYGAITTQAVKTFQKQQGLNETGIANHETQLKLHRQAVEIMNQNPENWIVRED